MKQHSHQTVFLESSASSASWAVVAGLFLFLVIGCKEKPLKEKSSEYLVEAFEEAQYRPNFHFTPEENWMNDPNGMFFFNDYYHLYYQYHPDSNVWGPMHWGHAISTDMITWKEQPIAIAPDELGYIFSGSAVVDTDNTSGFGTEGQIPIVAIFTSHNPKKAEDEQIDVETQSIAYSLDGGMTFIKFEGNPVIENPGIRDFRDPKVSWNEEKKIWNMVLAANDKIMFYESKDLKEWTFLSDFGKGIGAHGGVWECPDLFPLPVEGSDEIKWVLLVSINNGGPNGGSATQYFIGDFDGKKFTMDENFKKQLEHKQEFWVDFGRDNYAGVTWSNIATKNDGKYFVGWMSNWQYANEVPTETWRGAMTVPRELRLVKSEFSHRLAFAPVAQLQQYRSSRIERDTIAIGEEIELADAEKVDLSSAEIKFDIDELAETGFRFKLSNSANDELLFGFDAGDQLFFIDRCAAGKSDFDEDFMNTVSKAPRIVEGQSLNGTILLDKTSIEIFYDDGRTVMTEIFFTNAPFESLSISSDQEIVIDHFEVHQLNFD